MIALTCKNCGGRINPATMQCEYCGTQYEKQLDGFVILYADNQPMEIVEWEKGELNELDSTGSRKR